MQGSPTWQVGENGRCLVLDRCLNLTTFNLMHSLCKKRLDNNDTIRGDIMLPTYNENTLRDRVWKVTINCMVTTPGVFLLYLMHCLNDTNLSRDKIEEHRENEHVRLNCGRHLLD